MSDPMLCPTNTSLLLLLQVNEVNFEELNNDDAVKVMRDIVRSPG